MEFNQVISFWFEEIPTKNHYIKDAEFDQLIRDRFLPMHSAAIAGELYNWREEPLGRLAEIIILDQFSRNMFRDTAEAFASDSLALVLAQEAVHSGDDLKISEKMRSFVYMPYMHSESLVVHEQAMKLFGQKGFEQSLKFEVKHKEIIERFGRYPHRNEILGRDSTPEEIEFLKGPGSSF